MSLAPWRPALAHALHGNRARPTHRYLQLATLNLASKPSNRTVVFRGFVGDALQMITDGRSEKVQQIRACPWAEVCWYFTVTREQFRLAGDLSIVESHTDPQELRTAAWQALSTKAQSQFYWPPLGQSRIGTVNSLEPSVQPPDNFQILLLDINHVDHLSLKGDPQEQHIYAQSVDGWTVQSVNP